MRHIRYAAAVAATLLLGPSACGAEPLAPVLPGSSTSPTQEASSAQQPAQASPPPRPTRPPPRRTPTVPGTGQRPGFPDGTPPFRPLPPGPQASVVPGAECGPEGALGYTSTGVLLRCTLAQDESRPRWHSPG
jgi:hypothetical protein